MQGKDAHLLTLKVMRLSKPTLAQNNPTTVEPTDFPCEALQRAKERLGLDDFVALTETLNLPQNFGNIYLGEKFVSYIRVSNDSNKPATDVGIRAELQTNSQRVTLTDTTQKPQWVGPANSLDIVVTHEVKELGKHTLICTVTYTTPDGDKMFFRKSFKFMISNPLAVKTKVYNVEREVFLEAQVQNLIPLPMYIENVHFEPNPLFTLTDLNSIQAEPEGSPWATLQKSTVGDIGRGTMSTFGRYTYINPNDIRQYLYRMTPVVGEERNAQFASTVGKLDITWRTSMGEMGRLQTSQLPRKVIPHSDLTLVATAIPKRIVINHPFTIQCVLSNMSDRRMSLRLYAVKAKMSSILVNGISGQHLGEFPPNSKREVDVNLFPVAAGLHSISGLRVTDLISGRSYDIENLKDVFVHATGKPEGSEPVVHLSPPTPHQPTELQPATSEEIQTQA
eukprot:comp6077_c0_seq1/m.1912 comp6077_c0_seq1/g.1912  ORF comp6077_c0_seq1/g.1912 comp6077_c0_seq1/m.1912 type:complete len:450 (-) comp6077_c0_seq1:693-2042(-)